MSTKIPMGIEVNNDDFVYIDYKSIKTRFKELNGNKFYLKCSMTYLLFSTFLYGDEKGLILQEHFIEHIASDDKNKVFNALIDLDTLIKRPECFHLLSGVRGTKFVRELRDRISPFLNSRVHSLM